MKIDIPDSEAANLFSASILAALTPETKEAIITQAVAHLLQPRKNEYSRGDEPSYIEQAFKSAIEVFANKYAREQIAKEPKVVAALDEFTADLVELDFDSKQKVMKAYAQALVEVISERSDH